LYLDTARLHSRERQLWCAVIGRALQDAVHEANPGGDTGEQARIRDEARQWFVGAGRDYHQACESAGFDPDYVREFVLRMIEPGPRGA